jgi:hypothetical protein
MVNASGHVFVALKYATRDKKFDVLHQRALHFTSKTMTISPDR